MQAQTVIGFIIMAFVIVVIVPLLLFGLFPGNVLPEDTVWTNEQYHAMGDKNGWGAACPPDGVCHQLDDGPSPFYGFLKVLGIIAVLGTIALAIVYAMAPARPETFDPPV